METFAKVAGVTSMATGGLDKISKILSGEAKMLKNQQKRQRAEEKDAKALIIAEELDIHANWLREKGSLIQAMKDHGSGYDLMSEEERELNEELRIEKVKAKQKNKMVNDRRWASELGGLKEAEFLQQHQFNLDTKAAREAEKDLKKKEKSDLKRDELRIAELSAGYHRLGAFDGMDKKDIAATIKKIELQEKANERDDEIAGIQEKYLKGSSVRLARLVSNLKSDEQYSGKFKGMSDKKIIAHIQESEIKQKGLDRQEEIAKAEEEYLGIKRDPEPDDGPDDENGPSINLDDPQGSSEPGAGADGAEVVSAIQEQTDEIVQGLGTHSPPFLETLTKDGVEVINPPTVEGENIGVDSAPDTNGVNGSEVGGSLAEVITAEEALPVESDQIADLLAIEDKKMDYLRRGEARDVKKMRLAVEAGRDKSRLIPKAPGGPTLNKIAPDEGGGLLSTLGKIFMSPLGRIGTAIASITGATTLLTGATGLLTTATTSMGSFANKLLPNWMKKMLPAPGSPTVGGPGVGRGNAPGSKATQFKKAGKDTAKAASKIGKHAKGASKLLGRAAVPLAFALEAFNMFSNEQDESLDRTEKNIKHTESVGGMAGAAGGASMGAAIGTVIFPGVGTIIGGMIGGGLGYFLGGEISKTVAQEVSDKTNLATADERLGELPEADQKLLMKEAEKQGAVDVGLGHGTITDLEKLSKLDLSSIESLLDQETWEKEDREKLMKIRSAKKEGRAVNVKDGGFWGEDTMTSGEKGTAGPSINVQEKLEKLRKEKKVQGRGYQQYQGGGKKEKTEEDKIAQEYEDKELEELQAKPDSELDNADLRKKYNIKGKFTKSKVRSGKKKMALKKQAKQLKDAGRTKGTFKEGKLVPEPGDQLDKSAHMKGATVTTMPKSEPIEFDKSAHMKGSTTTTADTTADNYAVIKAAQEKYLAYQAAQTSGEPGSTVETLTPETFDELTPQKELQDTANTAMTTEGSIFTHDTHLEKVLWDIWAEEKSFFNPKTIETSVGIEGEKDSPLTMLPDGESGDFSPQMNMFGNAGELMPIPVIDVSQTAPEMGGGGLMTPSGPMLEQTFITKMMEMQTQADTASAGGQTQLMNAPTTINNDNSQMVQSGSTARGPLKPGTGRG